MKLKTMLCACLLVLGACASDDTETVSSGEEATDNKVVETGEAEESGSEESSVEEADSAMSDDEDSPGEMEPVTITLVTHDSFAVSEGVLEAFTEETGITVEVISGGDAGEVVARAVLTSGQPEGDVLFGVDNTFLQRTLDADVFTAYVSTGLDTVDDALELDAEHRVTPIDYGDVCINYVIDSDAVPNTIDDLADASFASNLVTMNPETSSPGFAFLLATIAAYGEDGWQEYWQKLTDGGVTITSGWSDAYYGEFVQGGGDKTMVTSYATSPVAEVFYADPAIDSSPTGVLTDSCFRQVEFAGVLRGTEHQAAAEMLIDFMLGEIFQADIPLNMFVFPANGQVELPEVFTDNAVYVESPLTLSPSEIEANRSAWTEQWTEIVLR